MRMENVKVPVLNYGKGKFVSVLN